MNAPQHARHPTLRLTGLFQPEPRSGPRPAARAARLAAGAVLNGKWRLDRWLGEGGMATVFAATHRNGRRAAIKLLHPLLAGDAVIRTRFLREAVLANAVDHPDVPAVLDDDVTADGAVFLVMELLEGCTVDAWCSRAGRQLSARHVVALADRVLAVLMAAHEKGIVHRDLKPENLFLTRTRRIKVLDFGIAHWSHDDGTGRLTQSGMSVGTPAFMPPEQALGHNRIDGRSDLWALGASMYSLLSGRHAHEGATSSEVLLSAMTRRPAPIGQLLPELDPELATLIDRALAFDLDERWQCAVSMRRALRGLASRR